MDKKQEINELRGCCAWGWGLVDACQRRRRRRRCGVSVGVEDGVVCVLLGIKVGGGFNVSLRN